MGVNLQPAGLLESPNPADTMTYPLRIAYNSQELNTVLVLLYAARSAARCGEPAG
jgi:hypothetical protein